MYFCYVHFSNYIQIVNGNVMINDYLIKYYLCRYIGTVDRTVQGQNVNNPNNPNNPITVLEVKFGGINMKSSLAFAVSLITIWALCLYKQQRLDLMEAQNINILNHFT